ncbi:MAG: SDR family oxidoreductase [Gammaproteobacteria bacterium SHHR-1]|uniref:SDR family oxidoreductase n=1 Tax=Magnetovirga frankeli TaxID=947516 RepID=UPI0012931DFF|nr:SDR family oxidoreductase [gamma proteobacterium SS-5]
MNDLIIAGCGYLGQRLAQSHHADGDGVLALVRSPESLQALQRQGVNGQCLDLDWDRERLAQAAAPDVERARLYWLIPPQPSGEEDSRSAAFLRLIQGQRPGRVVLISTTGVYGDCQGAWVDETRPVKPKAPRALRRWSAEQQWRDWADGQGVELVILRLPGIYGPGRLPLARLQKGLPMLCEAEAPWSNRIHIDDLTQVCRAAMDRAPNGSLYHVSDGQPSTMLDYFNRVADLAGLPRPEQISRQQAEASLSTEMLSYLNESRRIDNRKMLKELAIELRYPGLDQGLAACWPTQPG